MALKIGDRIKWANAIDIAKRRGGRRRNDVDFILQIYERLGGKVITTKADHGQYTTSHKKTKKSLHGKDKEKITFLSDDFKLKDDHGKHMMDLIDFIGRPIDKPRRI